MTNHSWNWGGSNWKVVKYSGNCFTFLVFLEWQLCCIIICIIIICIYIYKLQLYINVYIHKYVRYIYIYVCIYTFVYTWTLVNEMKHHESNLTPCWAESEGSQNGFPAEPMIRFFDEKICGIASLPLKVPFPWWFSQRKKNWVASKKTCQMDPYFVVFWMIVWSWRDEGAVEFHLFFMGAIWGLLLQ